MIVGVVEGVSTLEHLVRGGQPASAVARAREPHAARPLLRERADLRTLLLLVLLSALYVAAFAGAGAWLWAPCTLLTVTACAAKHDHVHCRTFSRRWANRCMDVWLTLLTGTSTTGIRVPHLDRHHRSNQTTDDFVRCDLVAGRSPLVALLLYVPRVALESWRRRASGSATLRAARRRACRGERAALWALIALALWVDGRAFLLAFAAPWLLGQWFLLAINLPQHDGCDPASPHAHSRDALGPVANWLFLDNGFHAAHREAPGLHWSRLPALHRDVIAPHAPADLACPSLVALWARWWRRRAAAA